MSGCLRQMTSMRYDRSANRKRFKSQALNGPRSPRVCLRSRAGETVESNSFHGLFPFCEPKETAPARGKIQPGLPKHVNEPLARNPLRESFVTLEEGVPLQEAVGMSKHGRWEEQAGCRKLDLLDGDGRLLDRSHAGRGVKRKSWWRLFAKAHRDEQRGLLGLAVAVGSLTAKLVRP